MIGVIDSKIVIVGLVGLPGKQFRIIVLHAELTENQHSHHIRITFGYKIGAVQVVYRLVSVDRSLLRQGEVEDQLSRQDHSKSGTCCDGHIADTFVCSGGRLCHRTEPLCTWLLNGEARQHGS
jgi:hypothetical protein